MVMDTAPSPQSVGREFVRQYYTLLNQAPLHLHRFYNQQSSFVHGGLDASSKEMNPVIGQKQIHQKIQQLNFRDCHAKITQVDSQATLGDGVVVQVTGELSNAGEPMRRFTQTFVLGAQAPKKYYVHNDIFRYQDMVFPDEEEGCVEGVKGGVGENTEREGEEGGRSEPEEDQEQNQGQTHLTVTAIEQQVQPPLLPTQQAPLQQVCYAPQPQQQVHPVMQPVTINGSIHEEAPLIAQQPLQQPQQQAPPATAPLQPQHPPHSHTYIPEPVPQEQFPQESDTSAEQQQQAEEEPQVQVEESHEQPEAETFPATAPEPEPEHPVAAATTNSSGPKTYANLVKSFSNAAGATSPQAPKLSMSPPPMSNLRLDERSSMHPSSSGPSLSTPGGMSSGMPPVHRVGGSQPPQHQHPQQQRPTRGGPVQRDGDRRGRLNQYSDAQQLFLGNLPHKASEPELRKMFERFGNVVELRIFSKQTERGKGVLGSNNTRVPNYGFITFEDHQVVTKILDSGPFYFPDDNGQQQKLNVEKKIRPRISMDGGRSATGDGNMRPMSGQQQQQRGPGGPGGVIRGGHQGARGGRGGFSRGGDGGRGGGGMRQPGTPNNPGYQNRR
ncbi:ras GTPase-activating protein-binding protein 2 isoform X2 [Orussus abietinus]|uniref:ras GTPase-activating protein-binding protein 2 isoform X2 n=1 Tax=Orussus abietinus TaxID=222816 RepID=UPI0006268A8A|nr:ras GTPase-activating protein-binding protein 2 isoform X2 [Orussus abietinus]